MNTPHKELERRVWESDRASEFDPSWIKDELYALDVIGASEGFLKLADEGALYTNPSRSVVAYILGFTNDKPDSYPDMVIHKGRVSPPDIDMDIDDRRRGEAIEYARQKYGDANVTHIGTFSRLKGRQAIRDAARILGLEYSAGDKIAKAFPEAVLGVTKTIDDALRTSDFSKVATSGDAAAVVETARGLEHSIRQWGIHAAGVIIAPGEVTDYVPVMQKVTRRAGEIVDKGPVVSQWDMHRVEDRGLLKMDFLGLSNLGIIDQCLETVKRRHDVEIDIYNMDLDDEGTYEMLRQGHTKGVFQVESPGCTSLAVSIQPDRIEDLIALIALYRPGPLGTGMHESYARRKRGLEDGSPYHPAVKEVLDPTYSLMIYQEQVLQVTRILAGFSAEKADLLRKSIGKKQMDKIALYRDEFVQGCEDTGFVDRDAGNRIFSDIEYFAGYAFALAHAASYGILTYVTAYLKCHYPAEYMAALLTAVNKPEDAARYLQECRRMGIEVLPPSINESETNYSVISDDQIMVGFESVRGIGESISPLLVNDVRPYSSLYDFFRRVDPEVLNKAIIEHLVYSGALDELVKIDTPRKLSRDERTTILDHERQEMGLFITEHPLTGIWHLLEPRVSTPIGEMTERHVKGEQVTVSGILSRVEKKTSRAGNPFYILGVEDLSGSVEVLVFSGFLKKNPDQDFKVGDIIVLGGRMDIDGDEDDEYVTGKIFLNWAENPELPEDVGDPPMILSHNDIPTNTQMLTLQNLIERYPGNSPIHLSYPDGGATITFAFPRTMNPNFINELENVLL